MYQLLPLVQFVALVSCDGLQLLHFNRLMNCSNQLRRCKSTFIRNKRSAYSSKLLPKPGYPCAVLSTHAWRINLDTREEEVLVNYDVPVRSSTKLDNVKSEHALHLVSGKANSNYIFTRLVNRYSFLGDISSASLAFNQIQNRDAYLWNSMMAAYVRNGSYNEALECYHQFLLSSDVRPDFYTFPPLLKACRSLSDGQRLHCMVLKLGYEVDVFVSASLVHLYSRNGLLDIARDIFDRMPSRDMGSWNAMLSGYCQNENANETLDILYSMILKGLKMDSVTICSVLPMVAQLNDFLSGLIVHVYIIKHGLEFDLFVNNALINMYAKLGHLADAQYVFDGMVTKDVVSWNSMIAAYEQNNDPNAACWLFKRMLLVGEKPNLLTMVSLASAVAQVNSSQSALLLHCYCLRRYWLSNDIVIGNAVMDMYAKLGYLDDAKKVFDGLPAKDAISWNTLITGYTQNGLASEALGAYRLMEQSEYVSPNHGSWVNVLPACAAVGALKEGMKIHGLVTKNGLFADVFVGTCIVDMYGKCGRLDYAMSMFYKISRTSSVPWNAMISCHGVHGHASHAVKLFEEMLDAGVHPDYITFVSLLSACSHAGLLDEGRLYFQMMKDKCGIEPGLKHYGCMVDLLGRAGYLEEAYQFIKAMPIRPDASVWGSLLGACRVHGHAELGAFASERLFEVDSDNVGYYVLLSNIYASAGKWEVVDGVRSFTRNIGLRKTPGWSSIEVNNKVDVFYTGNQTHPRCVQIYEQLEILTERSKAMGYIPDFAFVLHDVENDEKEYILTSHSERLAMAFGIISTPHRTPLHIFKNLRVCGDCHNFTKLISLITERQIIVRDANRFHHFEDGVCSCGDYW